MLERGLTGSAFAGTVPGSPCLLAMIAILVNVFLPLHVSSQPSPVPKIHGDAWTIRSFLKDAGLEGRFLFQAEFDDQGIMWIATSAGVIRYDGYDWSTFTEEHGLPSRFVRCLRCLPGGSIVVGTDRGVATLVGDRAELLEGQEQLAGPNIRRIGRDPDGTLWFCSDNWLVPDATSGLTRYRNGVYTRYGIKEGLPTDYVSDYFRDSRGRRFALTSAGLAEMKDEKWRTPVSDAGLDHARGYAWSIQESPEGEIVLGTLEGLFLENKAGWEHLELSIPGGPHRPILCKTSDHRLITAVDHQGFAFWEFDGRAMTQLTDRVPCDGTLEFLAEGPSGAIWCFGYNLLLCWSSRSSEWTHFSDLGPPEFALPSGDVCFRGKPWVRFDGQSFHLGPKLESALPGNHGDVFGWKGSRFVRWSREMIETEDLAPLGFSRIRGMTLDPSGLPWVFGTTPNGKNALALKEDGDFRRLDAPELDQGKLISVTSGTEPGIWCVLHEPLTGSSTVLRVTRESFEQVPEPPRCMNKPPASRLFCDQTGVWLLGDLGMAKLEDSGWRWIKDLPGQSVYGAMTLGKTAVFGSNGISGGVASISRFDGTSFEHFDTRYQRFFKGSGPEVVFFRADGKIFRFPAKSKRPNIFPVPASGLVSHLVESKRGEIWAQVDSDTYCYRPDGIPPQTWAWTERPSVHLGEDLVIHVSGAERYQPKNPSHLRFQTSVNGKPWSETRDGQTPITLELPVGSHRVSFRAIDPGDDVDPTPITLTLGVKPPPLQDRWWYWPTLLLTFSVVSGLGLLAFFSRLRATNRERQSAIRYQTLVEHAPVGIHEVSSCGLLFPINRVGKEMSELAPAGSSKTSFRLADLVHPRDRIKVEKALQAAGTGTAQTFEFQTALSNDERIYSVALIPIPAADESIRRILVITEDISEQKRTEWIRENLNHGQRIEAVGTLASGIAHDFNNIIIAILGYTEIAQDKLDPGDDGQQALRAIAQAAQQARGLTRSLLTFGRKTETEKLTLSLTETLKTVSRLLHRTLSAAIEVQTVVPEEEIWVQGNPDQLQQVIMNLAINGRDAMPNGGNLTISLISKENDDGRKTVLLRVEDSGSGMSEEVQDRLFDPFFTTKSRGQGTGLGLAIVHGIVSDHQGEVRVSSKEGFGTRICVELPVCSAPVQDAPAPQEKSRSEETLEDGTVLLAEDNRQARAILATALSMAGLTVIQAKDGEEAVKLHLEHIKKIELVILDLDLPRKSGKQSLLEMRARKPDLATIMISGFPDASNALSDIENVQFIEKPFQPSQLVSAVRETLRDHRIQPRSTTNASDQSSSG